MQAIFLYARDATRSGAASETTPPVAAGAVCPRGQSGNEAQRHSKQGVGRRERRRAWGIGSCGKRTEWWKEVGGTVDAKLAAIWGKLNLDFMFSLVFEDLKGMWYRAVFYEIERQ